MEINSIFLITHSKEIENKRFMVFLNNLMNTDFNLKHYKIKLVIFMNDYCKTYPTLIKKLQTHKKIKIVFYGDLLNINQVFLQSINYRLNEFNTVLFLETDCSLKKNFLEILNNEIKLRVDFWVLGSYYYGNGNQWTNYTIENRRHLNGVAIYNRNEFFMKILNKHFKNFKLNYDVYIQLLFLKHSHYRDFMKNMIDSPSILNICLPEDISIKKEEILKIKREACIVHTKNEALLSELL